MIQLPSQIPRALGRFKVTAFPGIWHLKKQESLGGSFQSNFGVNQHHHKGHRFGKLSSLKIMTNFQQICHLNHHYHSTYKFIVRVTLKKKT